ncbi:hypothetical protein [Limnoglobus roseus]|nr:hypothetical protein [Limnoglobus roseus]
MTFCPAQGSIPAPATDPASDVAAPQTPAHYADNAELRALAQQARADGRLPARLADFFYRIADGYLEKFGGVPESDVDDFRQDLVIHWIERAVPRIFEKGGNPFAYLTEAAKNFARDRYNRAVKLASDLEEYQATCHHFGRYVSVPDSPPVPPPVPRRRKASPRRPRGRARA